MSSSDTVEKLAEKILYHKKQYYNGEPEISDAAYDQLEDKLRQLDPDNPVLHLVGTPDGGKVDHDPPMLSAQKATELDEVIKWASDIDYHPMTTGYKVDGLSLSIIYLDGKLSQAATRGNGNTGDDVTLESLKIHGIPETIEIDGEVNIRGEVYMKISEFHRVNDVLPDDESYSSPRNLATGTLKQKSLTILDERRLDFMAWQLLGYQEDATNMEQMETMKSWGFTVTDRILLKDPTPEKIESTFQQYVDEREELDFEIDGVIFKYNLPEDRANAGVTEHHPKWSIAWKFQSKGEITTVENIIWQVGRTGVLTPVAEVEAVDVAGATIRRATLHNADMVESLNVAEGDTVALIRAGDVIPKILEVVDKGSNEVQLPGTCPSCGTELDREGVDLKCNSSKCRERDIQQIIYWVQQTEIKGLGEKSIEKLYDEGIVTHYADLYSEDLTESKLVSLLGKNGEKIYEEIEKTRDLPFATFLAALGIRNLGPKMGKVLAKKYDSYEELKHASAEELTELEGISDLTAHYIKHGVNDPNTGDKVLQHDVNILTSKQQKRRKLRKRAATLDDWFGDGNSDKDVEEIEEDYYDSTYGDKKIYVTGSVNGFTKKELQTELELRGMDWHKSVSSNLDYLVYGERAGQSKLDSAQEKGVKILSWDDFNSSLDKPLKK